MKNTRLEYLQSLRSEVGEDQALFWALSLAIDAIIGVNPTESYEKCRKIMNKEYLNDQ